MTFAGCRCREKKTGPGHRWGAPWGLPQAAAQAKDRRERVRTGENSRRSLYPGGSHGPCQRLSRQRRAVMVPGNKRKTPEGEAGERPFPKWGRRGRQPAASPGGGKVIRAVVIGQQYSRHRGAARKTAILSCRSCSDKSGSLLTAHSGRFFQDGLRKGQGGFWRRPAQCRAGPAATQCRPSRDGDRVTARQARGAPSS